MTTITLLIHDLDNLWAAYKLGIIGDGWDYNQRAVFVEELEGLWLTLRGVTPDEGVARARRFVDRWTEQGRG